MCLALDWECEFLEEGTVSLGQSRWSQWVGSARVPQSRALGSWLWWFYCPLCFSLGQAGCSDTMGSCCSCLNRDSVSDNHPTKFKVPTAPSFPTYPEWPPGFCPSCRVACLEKVEWPPEAVGFLRLTKNSQAQALWAGPRRTGSVHCHFCSS